jgi:Asp-tRNA(Asn)/Glu-tRNA(Gln) amidotransferase A subunit family amidase
MHHAAVMSVCTLVKVAQHLGTATLLRPASVPTRRSSLCICPTAATRLPPSANIMHAVAKFTAVDVYQDLARLRTQQAAAFAAIKESGADYLVVPTVMHHYLTEEVLEQETATPSAATYNATLGTFTNFVNLLGMCAISVPGGRLPVLPLEVC